MNKLTAAILIITSFLSSYTFAKSEMDYNAQVMTRSFPVGFFTAGNIGRGFTLWKTNRLPHGRLNPWYGYIRPSATVQSSGLVNGGRVEVDLMPVSFFGFYVGKDITYRNIDMGPFNCEAEYCDGRINRTYIGSKFAITVKNFFAMSNFRLQRTQFDQKGKPFADERATIIAQTGRDNLFGGNLALGYKLSDTMAMGTLFIHNKYQKSGDRSQMKLLFTRIQDESLNYVVGLGTFKSRFDHEILSAIVGIQWTGEKGLKLF
ncbi:MAG: hypothetical protein HOE90_14520 [Bacteriovoracaceae bacterium]|jgi:hypothetical protein|nr:hypothetical protein [Bacteriovoracaceae bacterium]